MFYIKKDGTLLYYNCFSLKQQLKYLWPKIVEIRNASEFRAAIRMKMKIMTIIIIRMKIIICIDYQLILDPFQVLHI